MMKRFISLIVVVLMSISLVACGKDANEKLIEAGKNALASKQYESALDSFKEAIDNDSKDEEANKLYTIIKTYLDADNLYNEKNYVEAANLLNNIDKSYSSYAIKDDLDTLIKKNKKQLDYLNENDEKLESIETLISEEKYIDAETIVLELEKRELSDSQKEKLSELKDKVKKNISKEEEKEESDNITNNQGSSNNSLDNNISNNENSNNNVVVEEEKNGPVTSTEKAVELVKEYIGATGDYMPSVINVDGEDSAQYVVHAYDVVDNGETDVHTATVGWYYVNKSTGEVKSMF